MKHIYKGPVLFFLAIFVILSGCKKNSYGPVSKSLYPYYVFQPGSYWIYANDSTGDNDSVWANGTYSSIDDFDNTRDPIQIITVNLKSVFLESIQLFGSDDANGNYVVLSTLVDDGSPGMTQNTFLPIFSPYWLPAKQNFGASQWDLVDFASIPSDTINHLPLENIYYTYYRSKDSTYSNSRYSFSKIWIAKNVGIVKIVDYYRYYNIRRSYSLVRYHVVQD